MDIKFACDKCGRHLIVDRAAAGFTIDCPECGKPVCVPTPALVKPSAPPTPVDVKSPKSKAPPVSAPKATSPSSRNQPTRVRFGGSTMR